MKIPPKINIGGMIYDIKLIPGKEHSDLHGRNYIGSIDHEKCLITLEKDMDGQMILESLLHEIMHGIEYSNQLKLSEKNVFRIARGFYQVLKNNNLLKD